jgi:dehydrogenase/reductase SDR family member 12
MQPRLRGPSSAARVAIRSAADGTERLTGAASGIGLAASRRLVELGARVLAVGRNPSSGRGRTGADPEDRAERIEAIGCDISSLTALRRLADRLNDQERRLDVLINNAGVMPDERTRSPDGHELMLATHVLLAAFALTALLHDLLRRSAPARVINVSSTGIYGPALPGGELESERDSYGPKKLYARTKREQVVITELWTRQPKGTGVVVHAMHPGWVDTKGSGTGFRCSGR